jgi:hypothetical protein
MVSTCATEAEVDVLLYHHSMEVRPLTDADAEATATWSYPGRESTYDVDAIVTAEQGIWAVEDSAELVGYCCFGVEARVPGVDPEQGTLDVGYGMRPDLVGGGSGRAFVGAILAFAAGEFSPQRFRLLSSRGTSVRGKSQRRSASRRSGSCRAPKGSFASWFDLSRDGTAWGQILL